jgi:hypothetical protein
VSRLALSLLAGLVSACSAGGSGEPVRDRQLAVFGGVPAPDDHAVVAVVNFAGGQCTGSLIAERLVLTARHCVADTAGEELHVLCGQTQFDPPDSAGAIFVVPLPSITEDPDDYRAVSRILMPEFEDDDLCGTDVVLLELAEPLTDIAPLAPRLDAPVRAGEMYSAVGFGVDASLDEKPSGERKRLDGLQVTCGGRGCDDPDVKENEWVGSGGPCNGDSGGPALDEGGRVIGVVSRGQTGCREPVFGDVESRAAWLKRQAIDAANRTRRAPPPWAPCGEPIPCTQAADDENDEPAETCAFSPRGASPTGSAALCGLSLLTTLLRRQSKNMSRRRRARL